MAFVCEAMVQTELGEQLRRARESKHWSLEEAEKITGIRKRFLQAMEEARWDVLPGEIQVRGFLRSYAGHLGLSGEDILALYERQVHSAQTAAALQSASLARPATVHPTPPPSARPQQAVQQPVRMAPPTLTKTQPAPPVRPTQPTPWRAAWPKQLPQLPAWLTLERGLIILAVMLFICVIVLTISALSGAASNPKPAPARPTATRLARSVEPPTTTTPATVTAPPSDNITSSAKTISSPDFVQVSLAATEHVWVRVRTDGKTAFEAMLAPGQALKWEAKEILIVETGNGAGLAATFNNKPVGLLGPRGQIVARAWTPAGETTIPPTPTAALPAPSPTP